ncbi:MAG: phosphoenolpyruvate mutase [Verrucomicrobia bacterium]|nr:phosphoenolpyruvate mutase [Verrucomicrobiota bacterium]
MTRTRQLRALLDPGRLDFLLEAHDGLSARIAEEAGFPGIWASGLAISAQLGVRDNNEASWTQVLEVAEFMADATRGPILLDGDTGFGNFNNFRRVVRKLEQRGIAGVCIEDKLFPKTNSFLRGQAQPLAAVEEFCGKIAAGKEAQGDADFVIVARTEALIAGWGLAEAVRRAEAYRQAGADAIIVHSAQSRPDEVLAFLDEWAGRHPVLLIPTKYHATPAEVFAERRVSALIWANHLLRAAIVAMQTTAARIRRDRSVTGVEEAIAPLAEVFRLQGDAELQAAEERFLAAAPRRSAVILAATRGSPALHPLTEQVPKTLLRVGGLSLLDRLCDNLVALNVREIAVVAGYRKEAVRRTGIRRIDNEAWDRTGEVASLALAATQLEGTCVIAFGDLLCRRHLLQALLDDEADLVVAADRRIHREGSEPDRPRDLVKLTAPAPHSFLDAEVTLAGAANSNAFARFDAEWIGLLKCSPDGAARVRDWLDRHRSRPDFDRLAVIDLLAALLAEGAKIKVHLVAGDWISIESAVDLAEASNLSSPGAR